MSPTPYYTTYYIGFQNFQHPRHLIDYDEPIPCHGQSTSYSKFCRNRQERLALLLFIRFALHWIKALFWFTKLEVTNQIRSISNRIYKVLANVHVQVTSIQWVSLGHESNSPDIKPHLQGPNIRPRDDCLDTVSASRPSAQNQTRHPPSQLGTQELLILPGTVFPALVSIVLVPLQAMTGVETGFHVRPGVQVLNVDYINMSEGVDVMVVRVLRQSDLGPVRPEVSGDVLSEDRAVCGAVLVSRPTLSAIVIPGSMSPQEKEAPSIRHREPDRFEVPHFIGWGSELVAAYLEPVLFMRVFDYVYHGEC